MVDSDNQKNYTMYKTRYREALFELDINLVDIEKKAITWITRYREALNKQNNYNMHKSL